MLPKGSLGRKLPSYVILPEVESKLYHFLAPFWHAQGNDGWAPQEKATSPILLDLK